MNSQLVSRPRLARAFPFATILFVALLSLLSLPGVARASLDEEPVFFNGWVSEESTRATPNLLELGDTFPADAGLSVAFSMDCEAEEICYPNNPTISPDGQLVAYSLESLADEIYSEAGIVVARRDGTDARYVWGPTLYGNVASLEFSADGGSLLATLSNGPAAPDDGYFRVDIGSGAEEVIDVEVGELPGEGARNRALDFSGSADGKRIVFPAHGYVNEMHGEPDDWSIETADSRTGELIDHYDVPQRYINSPRLSPDGDTILYSGFDPVTDEGHVWRLNVATGNSTKVSTGSGGFGGVWSPNGDHIVYVQFGEETTSVVATSPTGTNAFTVAEDFYGDKLALRTPSALLTLAHVFKPTWRFEDTENFYPQKLEAFTDNGYLNGSSVYEPTNEFVNRLVDRDEDEMLAAAGSPETGSLPPRLGANRLGANYAFGEHAASTEDHYIDARGSDDTTYSADSSYQAGHGNGGVVYARPIRDPDDGALWLQYWTFYYYNGYSFLGIGTHEGDWEMIQVRLNGALEPNAVTFANHNGAYGCDWSDVEIDPGPVVYVGEGSHASYPHLGQTVLVHGLGGWDQHSGDGAALSDYPMELLTGPWTGWRGRWGASIGQTGSPLNPSQQGDKWGHPSQFHTDNDEAEECED